MDPLDKQTAGTRDEILRAFPELAHLPPGTEVFGAHVGDTLILYNISKAREYALGRRPSATVDVAQMARHTHLRGDREAERGFEVDPEWAMSRDLSLPVIVVHLPDPPEEFAGGLIIDGWHRIYKAAGLHVRQLPAIVLTAEEEAAIRIASAKQEPGARP